jgi:hypothetical protein
MVRGMINFLVIEFDINEQLQETLLSVSPATIDSKLKKAKFRYSLKGIHTTKRGSLLKSRISVRVCFDRDEKEPGYFELDTVSRYGVNAKGQFRQTSITDVGSGWSEERALLNNAHRREMNKLLVRGMTCLFLCLVLTRTSVRATAEESL